MRVLVLLSHPPHPEGSAAGRCAVALLDGLRGQGLQVTALAADLGPWGRPVPPPELEVEVVPVSTAASPSSRAQRYTRPRGRLSAGRFAERVRELAATHDVVHADEIDATGAVLDLRTPAVAHIHCLSRRDRTLAGAPWRNDIRDAIEYARAERRAARRVPVLLANSGEVAADLRADGARDVAVMPLALQPAHYEHQARLADPVAGLIGTASWPPTANAVELLLREVWPRVVAARPGARLLLAGRGMHPDAFPDVSAPPGVEWVGEVPDASAFLRSLGALVYPLRRGSGTKVKVLEAMALGVPVVTTAPGAEGVAADGAGVAVHGDWSAMADDVVALMADEGLRRERGRAAREIFRRDHTPAVATAALPALYERVVAGTTR